ncbi:MAG: alpha/beta fold hydrolase [Akkermansiaceae bacterium]|nr:alpha/beta fold hydrolase [Armatimonadota bacterium]
MALLVAIIAPFGSSADAQTGGANPASGGIKRVKFVSEKTDMAGRLFLPANHKPGAAKLPAVLVVGPWLNVKEQVPTNYAKRLADKGFAAFVIDFRHWGESGGQPREYESPKNKIADIHNALRFLSARPEVDGDRIGVLGVCFGAGYVAAAATDDPHIKSVATVAAWVHDVPSVTKLFGAEEIARRRKAGREAVAAYRATKTVAYVPAASDSDKTAAMFSPDPNFYYATKAKRGVIPEWTNRYAVLGWEEWLDFDGIAPAAEMKQPLMVVHSDDSALPDNARRFYALAKGPKELVWMEGEHTRFYDTEPQITRAADAVAGHFARTLMTAGERAERSRAALAGTREFFAALEAMDVPRFLNVWAEYGVQEMPYSPPGFPKRLDGKAAIEKQYAPLPAAYTGMKFPLTRLAATDDPYTVIAEYGGSIGLKSGGRYDNRYVGVFTFDEAGKLKRCSEYFDPFTLLAGFPGAAAMGADGARTVLESLPRLADARDWAGMRKLFAGEVDFDYTSVAGGEPARVKADDLVAGWGQGLSRYKQTKHNFSTPEIKIEGDAASATFTGQATHIRDAGGGKVTRWSCGGDYSYRLARTPEGWKIVAAKFDMTWEQGER